MSGIKYDNFDLLINAIIKKAAKDYKVALKKSIDLGRKNAACREVERFFGSSWGYLLCMGYNEEIMKSVQKELLEDNHVTQENLKKIVDV